MLAPSPTLKNKEIQFCRFPGNETFLEKIPVPPVAMQLLNVIRHTHANFAPLDFISEKKL